MRARPPPPPPPRPAADARRAIVYTVAVAIVSLLYLTLLAAYFSLLWRHATTAVLAFVLAVSWAVALAAQALDPNNTFPARRARGGERDAAFRARVVLSAVSALLLFVLALGSALGTMGIWRRAPLLPAVEMAPPRGRRVELVEAAPRSPFMSVLARVGIVKSREQAVVIREV